MCVCVSICLFWGGLLLTYTTKNNRLVASNTLLCIVSLLDLKKLFINSIKKKDLINYLVNQSDFMQAWTNLGHDFNLNNNKNINKIS